MAQLIVLSIQMTHSSPDAASLRSELSRTGAAITEVSAGAVVMTEFDCVVETEAPCGIQAIETGDEVGRDTTAGAGCLRKILSNCLVTCNKVKLYWGFNTK